MKPQFNIGQCPICRQGLLLIVKGKDNDEPRIICDDCDLQWKTPSDALSDHVLDRESHKPFPLQPIQVVAANWDDIVSWGWHEYVKNIGDAPSQ